MTNDSKSGPEAEIARMTRELRDGARRVVERHSVTETQTVDLASWLTRIWDEEERLAKAATESPWTAEASSCIKRLPGGDAQEWVAWYIQSPTDDGENGWSMVVAVERDVRDDSLWGGIWNPADASFIAAHDPASVLARIAADRKILELHEPLYGGDERPYCETCGGWPCLTIRLLASPYKGREGWQEEWGRE